MNTETKLKTLMVDMDDVICSSFMIHLVNDFLGTSYKVEDITDYYLQHLVPENRMDEFHKYFLERNMYDYVSFEEGAKEALEKLNKKYDIYICSAFIVKTIEEYCSSMCKNKFEWLTKNLPFISPKNYIFCNNKSVIKADIKIDDRLTNLKGDSMKILYESYHNKDVTAEELEFGDIIRVKNWKEIEKILL